MTLTADRFGSAAYQFNSINTGTSYKFYVNGVLDKTVAVAKPANSYLFKIVLGELASDIPADVF